ncbi:MAG: hypothetical protein J7K68_01565 [Candidatus Diapherotrites archaeon]|nr:hypothetical protein [Candidatus Diapherotrites archaeon]
MDTRIKNIIAVLALFLISFGIGYVVLSGSPSEPLKIVSFDVEPQPSSIGWVTITIETNKPANLTVFVGEKMAEQYRVENNTYVFRYFVSPYEEDGLKQIIVTGELYNDSFGLVVNKTETIVTVRGIAFYSNKGKFVVKDRVYFFTELDPGRTERNKKIIEEFTPFLSNLAKAYNVTFYAVEADEEKWLSCYDSNNTVVDVQECENISQSNPSIILKLPVYPTSQVFVGNNTIEVQPSIEEIGKTLAAVYTFIPKPTNITVPEQ